MSLENNSYPLLANLQRVCLKQNIPFASYRLPLQTEISTLVQYKSFPEKIDLTDQLEQYSGFIIAPFLNSDQHNSFILTPDITFNSDDISPEFVQSLSGITNFLTEIIPLGKEIVSTQRENFIDQVNFAKHAIEEGMFHKVVLSKVRVEKLNVNFSAPAFFQNLCIKYPYAFVYMIQIPKVGCWIGATPEPILVLEDGKVKTVSLAGTQISTVGEIESYRWSEKEIEEQGIVTGFVENTLHSLKIDNFTKYGPANFKAGNLIHLKTSFEFEEADLKNRLAEFIKAFHPTPSVGGLPKEAARGFIIKNEIHDRAYYTGFLGPLNIENKSNLFVNLRCLQLFKKKFVLYSGAGITASSIAENEWDETDNKMLTMMNAMEIPNP